MPFASFLTSLFGCPEKKQKLKTVKTVSATLPEYLNWNHFEKRNGIVYLATKNSMLLVFMKLNPHTDYYSPTGDEDVAETWNRLLMTLPDKTSFWYEFGKPAKISSVRVIFDSDFSDTKRMRNIEGVPEDDIRHIPGTIARDFSIEVFRYGEWQKVLEVKENRKRYLRLNFTTIPDAEAVRLVPKTSWDENADSVHLFAFEVE